jgi:flagellar biogenesis protein FliO
MNTATTIAIVAIMAALLFVVASNFAVMKVFAQRNPTPSPNSQAYYHACVYQQPGGTHAAFCYPP